MPLSFSDASFVQQTPPVEFRMFVQKNSEASTSWNPGGERKGWDGLKRSVSFFKGTVFIGF